MTYGLTVQNKHARHPYGALKANLSFFSSAVARRR